MALDYGKVARLYKFALTATGFERGINNFIDRELPRIPRNARLLDAGCGTGFISLHLAKRFPDAEIIAFDIDERMLDVMIREREKIGNSGARIHIAHGDLANPEYLRQYPENAPLRLAPSSLDAIIVSGALEHVPLAETMNRLAGLLKPRGTFLNLGMRQNAYGAIMGQLYRFRPYTPREMTEAISGANLGGTRVKHPKFWEFPVSISRIGFLAQKN